MNAQRIGARMCGVTWWRIALAATLAHGLATVSADSVAAGGGPENAVLIVDPNVPESVYVARYYQNARGIPDRNVLYMAPGGPNYPTVAGFQIPALHGTLATRGIDGHIDYVVVPPGGSFFVAAPNLVDGLSCPAPVRRIATSSVYTLAFLDQEILAADRTITEGNRYFSTDAAPRAFDAGTAWRRGVPSTSSEARQYFIGFQLGYDGPRGNTITETLTMIDRSVSVDGTGPEGTFYLMRTDDIRSTPRHGYFDATKAALERLGGQAEVIYKVDDKVAVLPQGRHDALGVMTGLAGPRIRDADMTILPGAFADHITSYAGRFDTPSQIKMSEWIAKGASGSMGTVEEPCVFGEGTTGKFPHPYLNLWYYQGMSLGESLHRSIQWAPYQSLYYGDPLTRPFARFPNVTLENPPDDPVSGVIALSPSASNFDSAPPIGSLDLLIDGVRWATITPGASFRLDTAVLDDGFHDLRFIAHEDSLVATQGRWQGALEVDNQGRDVTVDVSPSEGNLATEFRVDVSATGGQATEIQLLANGRIVAALEGGTGRFTLPGRTLGAGPTRLSAVAEFDDGLRARGAPTALEIAFVDPGPPITTPLPVAYGYTADVLAGEATLLDLPAHDPADSALTYEILDPPAQAAIEGGANAWLLSPAADAVGADALTYRVVTGTIASEPATVKIRYCGAPEIVEAPAAATFCPGRNVTLSVNATGERLAYQWYKDGVPIAGAIDSDWSIPAAGAEDEGAYSVEVTRRCGDVAQTSRSPEARLDLETRPEACWSYAWLPYLFSGGD